MRKFLLCVLSAAAILSGCGCVLMSDEDRDFYGKGWVRPGELDTPMLHHAITDPARHRPDVAPARVAPATSADDAQWLVPGQTGPQ